MNVFRQSAGFQAWRAAMLPVTPPGLITPARLATKAAESEDTGARVKNGCGCQGPVIQSHRQCLDPKSSWKLEHADGWCVGLLTS